MTLHIIGIGLNTEKDITVKGLELVQKSDVVYLDNYTAELNCQPTDLAKFYNKQIILAHREMVEGDDNEILQNALGKEVAFLVVGDPFSATTHFDIMMRAKHQKIKVTITNNASVLTAIGVTGLQLYKFGKTTSLPYPEKNFASETAYDVIKKNKEISAHTLILLDIKINLTKYMNIKHEAQYMNIYEALNILLTIEQKRKEKVLTEETFVVGCARLGSDDQTIHAGTVRELLKKEFGAPLHCLIVPGNLHFMEEEALRMWL